MDTSVRVRDLAGRMREVASDDPPGCLPVLLGAGCAEAAGVPGYAEIARRTHERISSRTPPPPSMQRSPQGPEGVHGPAEFPDDASAVEWFRHYLSTLGPTQRYRVLEPHYRAVPVPSFYRDLADLVLAGHLSRILTTNVDSLLEQALDRAGMRRGIDYEVLVLGSQRRRPDAPDARLRIVKLHGDLGEAHVPVTPSEIEDVLRGEKSALGRQLLDELVVVGHRLDGGGEPVDDWLWRTSGQPLWWATEEPPEPHGPLAQLSETRRTRFLVGADRGTPESLFAWLSFYLLRLPALRAVDAVDPADEDTRSLEMAFQRSELLKTRAATHELHEQVVPGVPNHAVAAELAEQQRRSVHHQARLTAVTADRQAEPLTSRIAEAVDRVLRDATSSRAPQTVVDYLRDQANVVLEHTASHAPDRRVISAALAGVVTMADELGDDVSVDARRDVHAVVAELRADRLEGSDSGWERSWST